MILRNKRVKKRDKTQTMLQRRDYFMNEKEWKQNVNNALHMNKQKPSDDITASIDELKKEHESEYVFLYWET